MCVSPPQKDLFALKSCRNFLTSLTSLTPQKKRLHGSSQPEETVWESAFQVEGKGKVPSFSPPPAVDIFKRMMRDER
jgi:hypothetical protein